MSEGEEVGEWRNDAVQDTWKYRTERECQRLEVRKVSELGYSVN